VVVRRDGLHIRIRNANGPHQGFAIEGVSGGKLAKMVEMQVATVAPGTIRVQCDVSSSDAAPPPWVSIEVLDPHGYFVPDVLTCGAATGTIVDYATMSGGSKGDVVAIARSQIKGRIRGDTVERAGYVGAAQPKVRVVRHGTLLAVGTYMPDRAGGWLIDSTNVCSGSGIRWP